MSDMAQGAAWWFASDGKWYPPELHPSVVELQPSPQGWSTPVADDLEPRQAPSLTTVADIAPANTTESSERPSARPSALLSAGPRDTGEHRPRRLIENRRILVALGGAVLILFVVSRRHSR